ncbi:MAG: cytochrome c, partial [Gammaproteobacteria bacterium]
ITVASICTLVISTGVVQAAGDPVAGKTQSSKCAGCHGADGRGQGNNPPLAGKKAADFVKQMQDYKSGARKHVMMNMMAKPLSDQDIADLAAYYASLKTK